MTTQNFIRLLRKTHFYPEDFFPKHGENPPIVCRVHDDHDGTNRGNLIVMPIKGIVIRVLTDVLFFELLRFRTSNGGGMSLITHDVLRLFMYMIQEGEDYIPDHVQKLFPFEEEWEEEFGEQFSIKDIAAYLKSYDKDFFTRGDTVTFSGISVGVNDVGDTLIQIKDGCVDLHYRDSNPMHFKMVMLLAYAMHLDNLKKPTGNLRWVTPPQKEPNPTG